MKKLLFFLLLLTNLWCTISWGQTFLNGDFENHTATSDQINLTNPDYNSMMANSVAYGTYGDMDIISSASYGGLAQNGTWYVGFTGGLTDAITMELSSPLIAGTTYTLSYWDRAWDSFTADPVRLGVSTTPGVTGTTFFTGPVASSNVWTQRTVTFVAPATGLYISVYTTTGSTSTWTQIDNFAFTVPTGTPPITDFTASTTSLCPNDCITFTDITTNSPTTWNWTFAGGTPATSSLQNPGSICYATAGTYQVSLQTSNASGTDTETKIGYIVVNATPSGSASSNTPVCTGSQLDLTVPTTAGATYSWTGPNSFVSSLQNPSIPNAQPVDAGTYTVTVTAGGCSSTSSVTVTVSATIPINLTPAGPFCESDGSATLTADVAGGTWSGTGITDAINGIFDSGVAGIGTHTINYDITTGCSGNATQTIVVNPNPTGIASSNSPLCVGSQLDLSVTATAGATYSWTGPNSFSSTVQNPSITNVQLIDGGSYTVTVTNTGCSSSFSTSVVVNSPTAITINPTGPFCESDVSTTLTASVSGGTWSGAGIVDAVNGIFDPNVAGSGSHTISYTITTGCGGNATATIVVNSLPTVDFSANNLSGCNPLNVTFTDNSAPTSSSVVWDFGNGSTSTQLNNVAHIFLTEGCYSISLTATTAQGCTSSISYSNFICVLQQPDASFVANPPVQTIESPSFVFINNSENATSYTWNFGDGSSSSSTNPIHNYIAEAGNYTVELIAYNEAGCTDTARQIVEIQDLLIYYVPNSFTPNGDEHNNTFQPVFNSGFDPYDYNLVVFNRWGETLFESNNNEIGWDGTYLGKAVPTGIYTWRIEFKVSNSDERKILVGHVNVLR